MVDSNFRREIILHNLMNSLAELARKEGTIDDIRTQGMIEIRNNDIETTKETGFKVHKLPTTVYEQTAFIEKYKKIKGKGYNIAIW